MRLMSIWAQCQPVRVVPQSGDVRHSGYLCRRIHGEWCYLNPMAGDWYRCKPEWAAVLDVVPLAPEGQP